MARVKYTYKAFKPFCLEGWVKNDCKVKQIIFLLDNFKHCMGFEPVLRGCPGISYLNSSNAIKRVMDRQQLQSFGAA